MNGMRKEERKATEAVKALALLVSDGGGVIGQAPSFGYHEFMISRDRRPCFEIIMSSRKERFISYQGDWRPKL